MTELPLNWIECEFIKIADLYTGNSINEKIKTEKYTNLPDGLNYIATKDIGYDKKINYNNGIKIPFKEKGFKIAPANSSLLCIEGGSAGRKIGYTEEDVCFVNKLCAFVSRLSEENSKLIYYYLQSNEFKTQFFDKKNGLIGGVGVNKIKQLTLKTPPLNEQKRIVKKLDAIIPKVDEINSRLERIPTILKRARQSILNQAITGELTKEWRKEHFIPKTTESVIDKINVELSKLLIEKKVLKENSKIYPNDIEKINNNWYKTKARFLCHHITKGTTPKVMTEIGDVPYLKVYNIVNNKIDFKYKPQFVSNEVHNKFLARSKVYPNDVLMNIVGPPLGKIAIVPNDYMEWNINQAIAFFRPIKYLTSEFLYLVLCCENTLLDVLPDTKGIVGQSNISLEQCRDLIIPLPPLDEQEEIVRQVKILFEKLDKIEESYKKAKQYTDKITQSVLHKAFTGNLVPQDPNDKPIKIEV